MFLLIPAHLGSPIQNPESHKMVLVVVVVVALQSQCIVNSIPSCRCPMSIGYI